MGRSRVAICAIVASSVVLAALPATGRAQTVSFVNATEIRIPGTFTGPATPYPSSVTVSGFSGTVAKATVVLIDVEPGGNIDALDLALVGPNGAKVMLWSDACGTTGFADREFTFDGSAATFLSNGGPCTAGTYLPSNYEDPALDDLSAGGAGPAPPFGNSLSLFNGISPNGTWGLFAFSDTAADFIKISGWALTLEISPEPVEPAVAKKKCKKGKKLKKGKCVKKKRKKKKKKK